MASYRKKARKAYKKGKKRLRTGATKVIKGVKYQLGKTSRWERAGAKKKGATVGLGKTPKRKMRTGDFARTTGIIGGSAFAYGIGKATKAGITTHMIRGGKRGAVLRSLKTAGKSILRGRTPAASRLGAALTLGGLGLYAAEKYGRKLSRRTKTFMYPWSRVSARKR
jgi:hypothetical protein